MNIRPYESTDLEKVLELFRSNIPKYFGPVEEPGLRDFLAKFTDNYFVCDIEDAVIGAGGFAANSDRKTISLCWGMIHAEFLGMGFGRELTEFRIREALKVHGAKPILISTSQHTRGFYEKLGFRLMKHVTDGFGPGIDICEMRLEI